MTPFVGAFFLRASACFPPPPTDPRISDPVSPPRPSGSPETPPNPRDSAPSWRTRAPARPFPHSPSPRPPALNRAPSRRIVVYHFAQRGNAAVVHVRRRERNIAQRRRLELAHVGRVLRMQVKSGIGQGKREPPGHIVQAGIMKRRWRARLAHPVHRIAEIETA